MCEGSISRQCAFVYLYAGRCLGKAMEGFPYCQNHKNICPTCRGSGQQAHGVNSGMMTGPDDPLVYSTCTVCAGKGETNW
jgi:DnaJ-class molecular chaperone